ncbi:hypothetical protein F4801DRAFT_573543 [Xylaria longipes]|nr:hypothetical protein F4801DRAFT_573543 [Xylaria longipes]
MRWEFSTNPELCMTFLGGLDSQEKGYCNVTTLQPSKPGGYVQMSYGGANKFAMLQEILLWAQGHQKLPSDQCSHLCGEPKCLLRNHIIAESVAENNARKGCLVVYPCSHCTKYYVVCNHTPTCIKYIPGFESWEDFLQNGKHP